ncbi:MAG: FAD-dependent oxidoreductase, partial [Myxococcota bacterium]
PKWRTVAGGSQSYVQAIEAQLGKRIRLGTGVTRIAKFGNKVRLSLSCGQEEIFDDVILATHSDQAAEMLDLSFDNRKFTLGAIQYRPNQIYLHRDLTQGTDPTNRTNGPLSQAILGSRGGRTRQTELRAPSSALVGRAARGRTRRSANPPVCSFTRVRPRRGFEMIEVLAA